MSDDWTPAHHAVEHSDAKLLARLLAEGTDPNEACHGMTLLTHAIDSEVDGATQTGELQMAMLSGHRYAVGLLQSHVSRHAP